MNNTETPELTTEARRIKYDLCDRCDMARTDRHHSATYKMARSPYDIPRHEFVAADYGLATDSRAGLWHPEVEPDYPNDAR